MPFLTYQFFKIVVPPESKLRKLLYKKGQEDGHYGFQWDGYETERLAARAIDQAIEYMDNIDGEQFTIEPYYEIRYAN